MLRKIFPFLICLTSLFSCQNKDEQQLLEHQKDAKARALVFTTISNGWHFNIPTLNPETQLLTQNWTELNDLVYELKQIPKSSIGAFQKKSKDLSVKAMALNNNIPPTFNTLYIKSRIAALITKINLINLFINLDSIPEQKIIGLVGDVNLELKSLFHQMEELNQRNNIQREEGESDMIRMLDTARAIPSSP